MNFLHVSEEHGDSLEVFKNVKVFFYILHEGICWNPTTKLTSISSLCKLYVPLEVSQKTKNS